MPKYWTNLPVDLVIGPGSYKWFTFTEKGSKTFWKARVWWNGVLEVQPGGFDDVMGWARLDEKHPRPEQMGFRCPACLSNMADQARAVLTAENHRIPNSWPMTDVFPHSTKHSYVPMDEMPKDQCTVCQQSGLVLDIHVRRGRLLCKKCGDE